MKTYKKIIIERAEEIKNNLILTKILERTRDKFFDKSENEVILYDIKDYIISQLSWKKQSHYKYALPLIYEACTILNADFDMLFDKEPENYRDAYTQIEN